MKKIIINTVTILYFIIAITLTILLLSYNEYRVSEIGNHVFALSLDEEIEDVSNKGDLIIIKKEKAKNLKTGDKIFFYVKQDKEMVISQATVKNIEEAFGGGRTYVVDGNVRIAERYIIGKADSAKKIHHLGTIIGFLESKLVFLFVIVFPTFIIFLYEAYKVVMEVKYGAFEDME